LRNEEVYYDKENFDKLKAEIGKAKIKKMARGE